jgi:hypothetical protein
MHLQVKVLASNKIGVPRNVEQSRIGEDGLRCAPKSRQTLRAPLQCGSASLIYVECGRECFQGAVETMRLNHQMADSRGNHRIVRIEPKGGSKRPQRLLGSTQGHERAAAALVRRREHGIQSNRRVECRERVGRIAALQNQQSAYQQRRRILRISRAPLIRGLPRIVGATLHEEDLCANSVGAGAAWLVRRPLIEQSESVIRLTQTHQRLTSADPGCGRRR